MSTTTYLNLDLALFARHRPPLLAALAARVRGFALDRALAAGEDPASSRVLAVRAEQICRFDRRRQTASRLLEVARGFTGHGTGIALSPSGRAVAMAWGDLETLASELARPGPADPEGVARARLLLTDGASPLYPPGRGQQLAARARQACERLRGVEAL
jgi:hypothetical protein